ncbi:MAG TPA: hypothetical protein VMX17_10330 [Candidatus Glassbacteria bacterium]|nr:hypothetical protein [Candidatus Glassbacteria bacterium]
MKVWIHGGEGFPFYEVVEAWPEISKDADVIDVDIETLKRWDKVNKDFLQMQKEIVKTLVDNGCDHWGDSRHCSAVTIDFDEEETDNE